MPFALVTIGLIMVITGVKNTHAEFGALVKSDFTGPGNFTYWVIALGAVGSVGYIQSLRPLSHAMLALIIIVMLLKNGGFFTKLQDALKQGPESIPANKPPTIPASNDNSGEFKVSDAVEIGAKVAMFL
jgi:hypothetical protein